MKLVCDSCGTKYSIGDDRVAGKVFKIRCKKCSNVMVVRGAAAEPAPSSAPEPIAQTGDEWHAVVDGMQSGPFSRVELLRKHASGELDHETFVWREGLADWVALGTLEELRSELAAPAEPTAVTARPVEAPAARLLNERNESSVLFTLGNLAQLAAPAPKSAPATAAASGTEGSGLIDIRALASTFAPAKGTAKPASAVGSMEDLPVYSPSTFGEPIVLVPNARAKAPDRRLMIALLATLAMLAVLAVVLVLVVLRKPDTAEAAVDPGTRVATLDPRGANAGSPNDTPNGTNAGTANGNANGTNPGAPNGTNAGTPTGNTNGANADAPNGRNANTPNGTNANTPNGGGTPNGTNAGTPNPTSHPTPTTPTRTTPTTPSRTTPTTPSRTTPTTPPTPTRTTPGRTPTLTPDKEPNACTDVACAFNNYKDDCCKAFQKGGNRTPTPHTPTPAPTGNLNENLDRGQLATGIATIRAQSCGGKSSARGDVNASVKVSPAGTVLGVTILSSPDPVLSSCVTAAVQKGTFAKTKRGGSFKYVWRF